MVIKIAFGGEGTKEPLRAGIGGVEYLITQGKMITLRHTFRLMRTTGISL
jgi:hypothetical protein